MMTSTKTASSKRTAAQVTAAEMSERVSLLKRIIVLDIVTVDPARATSEELERAERVSEIPELHNSLSLEILNRWLRLVEEADSGTTVAERTKIAARGQVPVAGDPSFEWNWRTSMEEVRVFGDW